MWHRPRASMQRRLNRQLSKSCSSLQPLPSLRIIMANKTRSGAFGRPPWKKSGAKTDSSTRWVTSLKNTLCQERGSSNNEDLRTESWAVRPRNRSIWGGGVFLNIPQGKDLKGYYQIKITSILALRRLFGVDSILVGYRSDFGPRPCIPDLCILVRKKIEICF